MGTQETRAIHDEPGAQQARATKSHAPWAVPQLGRGPPSEKDPKPTLPTWAAAHVVPGPSRPKPLKLINAKWQVGNGLVAKIHTYMRLAVVRRHRHKGGESRMDRVD
jgi:hypothetical protein